ASILSQVAGRGNEMPTVLMQKIYSINGPTSTYLVGRNTGDGWLTIGHGTQQPANAIVLPLVVAPTAILAGLTLPALAKAKGKAQYTVCASNLRQMGLAAHLYTEEHAGSFPPDFLAMKGQLPAPMVLLCPAD